MRTTSAPHLWLYQARVFVRLLREIAARPGETFTVLFPRQAGKNEVQAWVVENLLRQHADTGGSIVICAPSFDPQARISLERVRRVAAYRAPGFPAHPAAEVRANSVSIGAATAIYLSASPEAHVAGHTANIALIADEAQEVGEAWFERQFRPMTASTAAPTILFGTPWDGDTLLDHAVARNRARQAGLKGPFHFEVPWTKVADSNPSYAVHVEQRRAELGEESPIFRSQYLLETVSSAGRMFPASLLAKLAGGHERMLAPVPGERYVAGLDLAGESANADAAVLTIGRLAGEGVDAVAHLVWRGQPFATVEGAVVELARRWGFAKLSVDATGMGAPFAARLEAALGRAVEAVVFSEATKSELGFALLAAAAGGRALIYKESDGEAAACWAELRACRAETSPAGKLRWGNERGHDDFVVSLALLVRAASLAGQPRVAFGRRR
ncbi:MAG: hypothetical protein ACKVVT_05580 [Dehalococcoidia bacterium]